MTTLLTGRTVILGKLEDSYNVDPNPVATDAIEAIDLALTMDPEVLERNFLSDSLSKAEHVIRIKRAEISFMTEMKGSGDAGVTTPMFGRLLQGCGFGETVEAGVKHDYAPISDASQHKSLTFYAYLDKMLCKFTGCVGEPEWVLAAGKFGFLKTNFFGYFHLPTDQTIITPSISETTKPPIVETTGFAMGGYSPCAQAFQIKMNNQISTRSDDSRVIVDRAPAGSLDPLAVPEAENTFWNDFVNSVAQALSLTVGSAAGNKIIVTGPKSQYDALAWGDRDGERIYDSAFRLKKNAAAGDDEIKISAQ